MEDTSEFFLLTQQFFSGQFKEVIAHKDEIIDPSNETFLEYYYRSKISLGLYDEVVQELSGKTDVLSQTLRYFAESLGSDKSTSDFENFIAENSTNDVVLKLGSVFLTRQDKLDEAISLIEKSGSTDLEVLLVLVLLRLYANQVRKAEEELANLRKISNDSIVYNLVESLVHAVVNDPQVSFYFFEEIEQQYSSTQNALQLFCLNLQLLQVPESEQLLKQIDPQADLTGDLIANQITLASIQQADTAELVGALQAKNPEHLFLRDHLEKTQLFDEVVGKYRPLN